MVTEDLYRLTERQRETYLFKIFNSTDCITKAPCGEPFLYLPSRIGQGKGFFLSNQKSYSALLP